MAFSTSFTLVKTASVLLCKMQLAPTKKKALYSDVRVRIQMVLLFCATPPPAPRTLRRSTRRQT